MIVCGYEKFSMVDFDEKIACTVFTGGCNFRCPFCQNGALVVGNVKAEQIDENEVFDYLQKRKGLVDAVCVTGGEPTLQPDLKDFLRQVRDMGYLTKLDTNGLRPDVLKSVLDEKLVDYVAMDVKNGKNKRERGHAPKRKRRLRVPHHSYKRIPYRRRYEGDCRFDKRREKVFYAKIQGQRRVHCARIFSRRKGRSGKIQDAV